MKQLKRGNRPLIVSLEIISAEDTALREIAEGKITYELATPSDLARMSGGPAPPSAHNAVLNAA